MILKHVLNFAVIFEQHGVLSDASTDILFYNLPGIIIVQVKGERGEEG